MEDDLNFFPPYDCAYVARQEILDEYPEIKNILSKLSGLIDIETMVELNYKADELEMDHEDIAREFLEENELI